MSIETQTAIRAASVADSPELAALSQRSFSGYPFEYVFTPSGIGEAIRNRERRYVMSDQTGRIIGSAVLGINESKMAEIMRVMVDPPLRRNGAALALTKELALDALSLGKYAWADVRADQIGMQRAALGAGLRAISLEQGKHVVYSHIDENGNSLGPARETMVHMTTLPIDELSLKDEILKLPIQVREQLSKNLRSSLDPASKDRSLCEIVLPSAFKTKERIQNNIRVNSQSIESTVNINADIIKIQIEDVETIIVLPDASAFILKGDKLDETIDLLTKVGVQVVTYYIDIGNNEMQQKLINSGLEASSIRPWVSEQNGKNVWQIAWRKTANDYRYCLHTISLDRIVERQVLKLVDIIKK